MVYQFCALTYGENFFKFWKRESHMWRTSLGLPINSCCITTAFRWWSKDTVAIVTGANKGIGFALVKRFAELGLSVVLTARDNTRGLEAVQSLMVQGLHVHFFRLDVTDPSSIKTFISWFREKFQALDILMR
ncbi:unnamed protein product [Thlaspi arvense]|uniref:Uncharacterized protein n=1 Tax=Thlaspi arvense TaxID=13288 RepID=A0AAU9RYI8_THLAR|nr:unnamed protein product [Thlaspi arvense]